MWKRFAAISFGLALLLAPLPVAAAQPAVGSLGSLTPPPPPAEMLRIVSTTGVQDPDPATFGTTTTIRVTVSDPDQLHGVRVTYDLIDPFGNYTSGMAESPSDTVRFSSSYGDTVRYRVSISDAPNRWIEDYTDREVQPIFESEVPPQVTGVRPYTRVMLGSRGVMWDPPVDSRIICFPTGDYGHECGGVTFEVMYSATADMANAVISNTGDWTATESHPPTLGTSSLFVRVRAVSDSGRPGHWSAVTPIEFGFIPI